MRLDKYISSVTDYSRAETKRLIKQGDISINDKVTTNPAQHVAAESDAIHLLGQRLTSPQPRYFMLHKPKGVICATEDAHSPTVMDLIDEVNKQQLQIVGRLDKDTTGLVLITDDGQWNHRIASPKNECYKTYHVTLSEPLLEKWITVFKQGIVLNNEKHKTKPATLHIIDDFTAELSLQEGKYHQVKRMFAAVGNHVMALHRQSIGSLILEKNLKPGEYRPLNNEEVSQF